jgi:diacylglycerol kinase (ATP)
MKTPESPPSDDSELPGKRTGIKRLILATGYSLQGLGSALKHESAFRTELIIGVALMIIAAVLPIDLLSKALLFSAVLLVLIVELLNSGLEWVVDYISLQRHPFAKRAKDMASAAVFMSLLNCGMIWVLVLVHHRPQWCPWY